MLCFAFCSFEHKNLHFKLLLLPLLFGVCVCLGVSVCVLGSGFILFI